MRARAETVARQLATGGLSPDPGKRTLLETRRAVLEGWHGLADVLGRDGNPQLAGAVRRFAATLPPPLTENEAMAQAMALRVRPHDLGPRSL